MSEGGTEGRREGGREGVTQFGSVITYIHVHTHDTQ